MAKKLTKNTYLFFGFVSLLIATYFLLKLIIEGIESNPRPSHGGAYEIKKAVQSTFHQGNTQFGETAGIQCSSNAYFAIIFSAIKKVSLWKATETNYVLNKGDMLFKKLAINQPLAVDELPHVVNIERYNIHIDFFLQHSDIFGYYDNLFEHIRNLDSSQTGNGVIFTCGRLSVSLIWGRNGVFLFDSHIRNIEGFADPKGSAVLLEFRLIRSLNNFIKRFYQENVPNSFLLQYDIQYIKVNKSTENISNIQTNSFKSSEKIKLLLSFQKEE